MGAGTLKLTVLPMWVYKTSLSIPNLGNMGCGQGACINDLSIKQLLVSWGVDSIPLTKQPTVLRKDSKLIMWVSIITG